MKSIFTLRRTPNGVSALGQRRRRWPNADTPLGPMLIRRWSPYSLSQTPATCPRETYIFKISTLLNLGKNIMKCHFLYSDMGSR